MERGLIGSTFVLCGLRYDPNQIDALYRELSMTLEDSSTYQLILNHGLTRGRDEGRVAEAQGLILRIGGKRFGAPAAAAEAAVRSVSDLPRLERIADRLVEATGWDDLLATP